MPDKGMTYDNEVRRIPARGPPLKASPNTCSLDERSTHLIQEGLEVSGGGGAQRDLVLLEQLPHLALRQRRLRRAALRSRQLQ